MKVRVLCSALISSLKYIEFESPCSEVAEHSGGALKCDYGQARYHRISAMVLTHAGSNPARTLEALFFARVA